MCDRCQMSSMSRNEWTLGYQDRFRLKPPPSTIFRLAHGTSWRIKTNQFLKITTEIHVLFHMGNLKDLERQAPIWHQREAPKTEIY